MKTRTITGTLKQPELFLAPRTEREYDATVVRLNELVDDIGDNPRAHATC